MWRARVNRAEPRTVCTVRGSAFMFYRLDVEAELHHVTVYITVSGEAIFYEERSSSTAQFPWQPLLTYLRRFSTNRDAFR